MRSSFGGTWLLGLMITFIVLFVAFIILNLNYSKTIRIKNDVVSVIEKYEGLNETSISLINNFFRANSYRASGVCTQDATAGVYGALSLTSSELEEAVPGRKYFYCIRKYKGANTTHYYQIAVFYKFNLPVLGNTGGFTVRGTTNNFVSFDGAAYGKVVGD